MTKERMKTKRLYQSAYQRCKCLGEQRSREDFSGVALAMQALLRQMRGLVHNQMTFWQDNIEDLFLAGWRSNIYIFHFQRVICHWSTVCCSNTHPILS